jgi:hypothetical protein
MRVVAGEDAPLIVMDRTHSLFAKDGLAIRQINHLIAKKHPQHHRAS